MIHCLPVKGKYLELIAKGLKKAEAHIYRRTLRRIRPGDILIIFDGKANIVRARVKSVRFYNTMERMLEREDLKKILPNANDKEEVINEFCEIYGISREEMLRKPMVVIEFDVLDFISAPEVAKSGDTSEPRTGARAHISKRGGEERGC